MRIIPYDPKYKKEYVDLNKAWVMDMFEMEETDLAELDNIDTYLEEGGQIFLAVDDDGTLIAGCMIAPREDGDWELMKLAARGMYTGTVAGSACLRACIDYAKAKGLPKVLLCSNRKCTHAIGLYRKFGFQEIPVDKKKFPFDRADIAFEMDL